jgi:hypothetical protein
MKRILIAIPILSLTLVASTAFAAFDVTPTRAYDGQNITVTCGNAAHYYGIYDASTQKQKFTEICTTPTPTGVAVGVYKVVESVAAQTDDYLFDVTPTNTGSVQVVPNFAGNGMIDATGETTGGFVNNIGAFLTAYLPSVLAVLAALIGLGFLITRVKRWIGKKA